MSEKGKARKLEDRSKPVRAHSGNLPTMGGAGMVPHHHNYPIPSENFHSGGRLAYRPGLGQLMQMRAPISNDMGPPIFMPSLNLGTPKPTGSGNVAGSAGAASAPPPPSHPNSKLKQPTMSSSAAAAFMTDMLTYPQASPLSAFHSTPLKAYMGTPPPPPPPNAKASSVPTTSLPMPTPGPHPMATSSKVVTMDTKAGHPMGAVTKVVVMDSTQMVFSTAGVTPKLSKPTPPGVAKLLATPTEGVATGGIKTEGGVPMSYYSPPGLSTQVSNSLSKMLMASSPEDSQEQATSSPGPSSSKPAAVGGVYSSDTFTVRSSGGMPAVAPPTPSTSGQPSSNVSFSDTTRLDRPPQPSAPHLPGGMPGVGGANLPKELSQQARERLTTAEVASNIIISNPGLTGKHIAAMTNSTQPPSTLLPHSAYSSPISSAELLPGHALLNQHMDSGWGYSPQHNSFHSPPPGPMTSAPPPPPPLPPPPPPPPPQDVPSNGSTGLKSRLESTAPPQSPVGGGGGQPPGIEAGVLSSPGQINSSPRPRILRGKRPLDGNWKLDGQQNSLNSPGSLKKVGMALPLGGEQPPSPSPDGTHPFNHVGVGGHGNRVEEFSASPRKKPRKQNVVANDDQYASNVPDTLQQLIQSVEGVGVGGGGGGEVFAGDSKAKAKGVGCEVGEGSGGKEVVEMRYLAQLRQSPYPINGVYKLRHHTALNHFARTSDVKRKASLPISLYDLANDKSSQHHASGWKLFHFNSQLEEVGKTEADCLVVMQQVQGTLETLMQDSRCLLDTEALRTTKELMQGNIDRCNRVKCHVDSTTADMFLVLDHKCQVLDVLDKYSNFKSHYSSISPSLSSSSSSHHKSQS